MAIAIVRVDMALTRMPSAAALVSPALELSGDGGRLVRLDFDCLPKQAVLGTPCDFDMVSPRGKVQGCDRIGIEMHLGVKQSV